MSNGERLYRNINAGMLWGNRVRKERVIPKNELYRVQKLIENKSRLKSVVLSVIPTIQLEHTQHYPQNGWVEHDPMEIWSNTQVAPSLLQIWGLGVILGNNPATSTD